MSKKVLCIGESRKKNERDNKTKGDLKEESKEYRGTIEVQVKLKRYN